MYAQTQRLVAPAPSTTSPSVINGLALSSIYKDEAAPSGGSRHYLAPERLHALAVYAETGSQTEASKQSGVGLNAVHNWVHEEGTAELLDELRSTIRYNHGWRIARMVGKGLDMIEQVWDKGNPHLLKSGQFVYAPAPLKDQVICTSILIDKWMLISGALSQSDRLTSGMAGLSQQLADLGRSLKAPAPSSSPPPKADPQDQGPPVGEISWG